MVRDARQSSGTDSGEGLPPLPPPSAWVMRFAPLIRPGGTILDLACGGGRHAFLLAQQGCSVTAVDRNTATLRDRMASMQAYPRIDIREADLETGAGWPFGEERFDAIIVANYLHRPILPDIAGALSADGVLVYETFAEGNGAFGRPSNPDFLLRRGELWDSFSGLLRIIAYEDGIVTRPRPASIQRICAVGRERKAVDRTPGQAAAALASG